MAYIEWRFEQIRMSFSLDYTTIYLMYKFFNLFSKKNKGTSFVEVVVGSALLLLVFVGIFGVLRLSTVLISNNKAKVSAIALANEQMEFLRSLSYSDVGTVGGIPSGNIPQEESITMNNINYTKRTFVQYFDSPADGLDVLDENGITADYKNVKVEVSWTIKNKAKNISLVSNIVPKSIETTAGGGTLTIDVLDALGLPLEGIDVRIINNTTTPAIDITTTTNSFGRATFPGTPAASEYEITVSQNGYSTAETYSTTPENPNPSPGHLTVIEESITTQTFQVDLVSQKTIRTFIGPLPKFFDDSFSDQSKVFSLSSTTVSGGSVSIIDPGAGYYSSGNVHSISITPQYLNSWTSFSWGDTTPPSTDILYQLHYESTPGIFTPIPDAVLPGNSTGFGSSPVSLSSIATSTYSVLRAVGLLSTLDASTTPSIEDWQIDYLEGPTPIGNITFSMRGDKQIGTDGGGSPIYKYNQNLLTNPSGVLNLSGLEWDNYTITIDNGTLGLDIIESCEPQPRALGPAVSVTTDLIFATSTTHSLLVAIQNDSGDLLNGVSVRLYRQPFDETQSTLSCGQTHFNELSEGTVSGGDAYSLDISLAGYENQTINEVDVSGPAKITVVLVSI
jgi:hypothetical protein